jgi:hypothetical protein
MLPGFSAAASLYNTSVNYQTSTQSITKSDAIRPAMIAIYDACKPGYLQLGEGENAVCIDPSNPWGSGNGDTGGPLGGPDRGGGRPGVPRCTPKCSPCRRTVVMGASGRWKSCTQRDCDVVMVRCS